MKNWLNTLGKPKVVLITLLFLLVSLVTIRTPDGIPVIILQLSVAISGALFTEWLLFGRVKSQSVQSTIITGMLIGTILAPGTDAYIIFTAAFSAIFFKKFTRISNRHIFNPATSGLVLIMIIFGNRTNWWGFSSPLLIVTFAGIILYRMNRLSLVFSYFITRSALFYLMNGNVDLLPEALEIPNLFFAFIMLTEPKTTPGKRLEQWIFGAVCAFISTLFFKFLPSFDGDLTALLISNLLYFSSKRIFLYKK